MTNLEVIKELKSQGKQAYLGVGMNQSTFSGTIKAIERRIAKISTTEAFFRRFGYVGTFDNWNYNIIDVL